MMWIALTLQGCRRIGRSTSWIFDSERAGNEIPAEFLPE